MSDIMRSWPAVAAAAVILVAGWGAAEGLDATERSAEKHSPLHMLLQRFPDSNLAWTDMLGVDHDYGRGRPDKAVQSDCVEAGESRCPGLQAAIMTSDRIKSVDRSQSTEDLTGEVGRLVKRGRPRLNLKRLSYAVQSSSSTPLPSSSEELPADQGTERLRRYPELFKAAMTTSLGSIRPHQAKISIKRGPQREGGSQVIIQNGHERWDIPFEETSRRAPRKRVAPSRTAEGRRKYLAERRGKETPEDRQKRRDKDRAYRMAKKAKDMKTGKYQANYVYQNVLRKARLNEASSEAITDGSAHRSVVARRPFGVQWGRSKARSAMGARTQASPGRGLPYDLNLRPDEQPDYASLAPRAWDDDKEEVLVRRTAPSGSNRGSASRLSSSLIRERTPPSSHQSSAQATGLASSSIPVRKYRGPKSKYAHFDALAKEMSANGQRIDWSAERTKEGAREGEIRIPIVGGESRVVHMAGPSESADPSTEVTEYQKMIQRRRENGTLDEFRKGHNERRRRWEKANPEKLKRSKEQNTRRTIVSFYRTNVLQQPHLVQTRERKDRLRLSSAKRWKELDPFKKAGILERQKVYKRRKRMEIKESKWLANGEQVGAEGQGGAGTEGQGRSKEPQQREMFDLNQPVSPEAAPSRPWIDLNHPPSQEVIFRQSGENTAQSTLVKRMEIKETEWLIKREPAAAEWQGGAGTKRQGGSEELLQRRMLDLNQPASPERRPSRPWIDLNHPPSQKEGIPMEVDASGSASHSQAAARSMGQHAAVLSHLSASGPSDIRSKKRAGRPLKYPHLVSALNGLREQDLNPVNEGVVLQAGSQSGISQTAQARTRALNQAEHLPAVVAQRGTMGAARGQASHPQAAAGSMGQHAVVPSHLSVSGPSHILTRGHGGTSRKYPHLLSTLNGLRGQNPKPLNEGVLHATLQSAMVAASRTTGQRAEGTAYERAQAVQAAGGSSMGEQLPGKGGRSKMPEEMRREHRTAYMRKRREDKAQRLYEYSLRNLRLQEIRSTNPALYAKRVEAKSKRQREWRRNQKAKAQEEAERAGREAAHGQPSVVERHIQHPSSRQPQPPV